MRATRVTAATLCTLLLGCGGAPAPQAPVPAPESVAPDATAKPAPEPKGPFLYRYEGKTGPIYLLGTIHMMVSAKDDLNPVVWEKFSSCSKVVLELDPTNVGMVGAMLKMLDLNGPGLESKLTAEEWSKLTSLVKNVPPNVLNKMQPWAAGMLLELAGIADSSKSMELEMVSYAKQHKMEIGALETVDDQLAALAASSKIEDLKKALAEYGKSGEALAELVKAYKAGDLVAFKKAFASGDEDEDPAKLDKLLKDRNEKWIPQIEKMLAQEGGIFIAVGAAHLYGEHGVLKLLADKGHHAERIYGAAASPEGDSSLQRTLQQKSELGSERPATYLGAIRSAPSRRMTSALR